MLDNRSSALSSLEYEEDLKKKKRRLVTAIPVQISDRNFIPNLLCLYFANGKLIRKRHPGTRYKQQVANARDNAEPFTPGLWEAKYSRPFVARDEHAGLGETRRSFPRSDLIGRPRP